MRVLLRRRITQPTGSIRFMLWARFEISDEERALVRRYDVESGYITIEGSRRDFYRAAIIAFFVALVIPVFLAVINVYAQMYAQRGAQTPGIPGFVIVVLFCGIFAIVT